MKFWLHTIVHDVEGPMGDLESFDTEEEVMAAVSKFESSRRPDEGWEWVVILGEKLSERSTT